MAIEQVKDIVTEHWSDDDLKPLVLFRGGVTFGQARRRLNFVRAMMVDEVSSVTEIIKRSTSLNDVAHLSGLHAKSGWQHLGFYGMLSRLYYSPTVLDRITGLRDYIEWLREENPRLLIYPIERISEISSWRTSRAWRRATSKPEPMMEVYPFIVGEPTNDHELLLAVDSLVPKTLLNETRADVCQDMIVAILTGETTLDNLRDAPTKYVKQFFKQSPSKYGPLSLDAPLMFGDESAKDRTIGNMIKSHC